MNIFNLFSNPYTFIEYFCKTMCFIDEGYCECCGDDDNWYNKICCEDEEKCSIFKVRPIYKHFCVYCLMECHKFMDKCYKIQLPKTYFIDKISFRETRLQFRVIAKLKFSIIHAFENCLCLQPFRHSSGMKRMDKKRKMCTIPSIPFSTYLEKFD